jgi:hypothetical protein
MLSQRRSALSKRQTHTLKEAVSCTEIACRLPASFRAHETPALKEAVRDLQPVLRAGERKLIVKRQSAALK